MFWVGGFRSLVEIQAGIHETVGSGHFRGRRLLVSNEGSDGLAGPERRALREGQPRLGTGYLWLPAEENTSVSAAATFLSATLLHLSISREEEQAEPSHRPIEPAASSAGIRIQDG